jgi:hypothetical protein
MKMDKSDPSPGLGQMPHSSAGSTSSSVVEDAFLSYSRRDTEQVRPLLEALITRGRSISFDREDIRGGEQWRQRLKSLIEHAQNLLFAISPASLASTECRWELDLAGTLNKRTIPVLLVPIDPTELPESLRTIQWIDATRAESLSNAIDQIIAALETHQEWAEFHTRLTLRAQERVDGGSPLGAREIRAAELMMVRFAGKRPYPTSEQNAFLIESRTALKRKRLWIGAIATMVVAVLGSVGFGWFVERRNAGAEQATKEIAAAVNLVDANRSFPDAFASLARLLATNAAPLEAQQAEATNVARYVLQRLKPFGPAYAVLPDGALFRWGGNVYLRAAHPVRLNFPVLSYSAFPAAGRLVVVSADSTVRVLDMQSGKTLAMEQFDEGDGLISGNVEYYVLPGTPTKVAVEFRFDDPNADEGHRWIIDVALSTSKLTSLSNRLTANADCTEFRGGSNDDDEDLTEDEKKAMKQRLAEEGEIAEKCLRSLRGSEPVQLAFPAALPETDVWRTQAADAAPPPAETVDGCPSFMGMQGRVRENLSTLDFSRVQGSDATILEQRIADPDTYGPPGCVIQFGTKKGRQYIVTNGLIGQWYVGLILCELNADDRILACLYPSYAWNGSGQLKLSDNGRFLTLAGYGSREGAFWNLIDLDRMEIIDPDERPRVQALGIVIGERSDTVMVATLVPDQPGAVEMWFYSIGRKPVLAARRVFEAPSGSVTMDEDGNELASRSIVFRDGGSFVLATPFQQVFAMRLDDNGVLPRWLTDVWHSLTGLTASRGTVSLVWVAPDAGFGASKEMKYEVAAEEGTLAAYSSRAIRLLNLTNGRFLSPVTDLTEVSPCSGSIQSVAIKPSGSVVAKLNGCIATRSAPVTAEAARARAANVGEYLGEGDAMTHRLTGEAPPSP